MLRFEQSTDQAARRWSRSKRLWNAMLLAVLTASLTACGAGAGTGTQTNNPTGQSSAQTGSQAASAAPAELTVALDWYPNALHTFLYAAQEQGYFRDENVNVTLQMPSDSNDPLKLAAANKVDLAISYEFQVIQARSEGLPVVSVGAIVNHPLNVIMTRKDSGINSPKDLAGKNIGYPSIPFDEALVRHTVRADGGDEQRVNFTDIGFDIIPALSSKRVDAVIGGFINHEQLLLEKNGVPVHVFKPSDFGVPEYCEIVMATSDQTLAQKQAALAGFFRAAAKGYQYVIGHKEAALRSLLANQSAEFPLDEEIERKSLDILIPLMQVDNEPFGSQKEDQWKQFAAWMKQENVIESEPKIEEFMKNLVK